MMHLCRAVNAAAFTLVRLLQLVRVEGSVVSDMGWTCGAIRMLSDVVLLIPCRNSFYGLICLMIYGFRARRFWCWAGMCILISGLSGFYSIGTAELLVVCRCTFC